MWSLQVSVALLERKVDGLGSSCWGELGYVFLRYMPIHHQRMKYLWPNDFRFLWQERRSTCFGCDFTVYCASRTVRPHARHEPRKARCCIIGTLRTCMYTEDARLYSPMYVSNATTHITITLQLVAFLVSMNLIATHSLSYVVRLSRNCLLIDWPGSTFCLSRPMKANVV